MKLVFTSLLLLLFCNELTAQVPLARLEWCKKAEIEIITGDSFPENYAMIGLGSFSKDLDVRNLDQLSQKLVRKMKSLAHAHHVCKVFVDFKNVVGHLLDGNGAKIDTQIHYYTICPLVYLVKKE